MAAPTKYKIAFNAQAEKLCKLGATDAELADFFEVCVDSINEWKKVYPKFSASIKKGKTLADSIVADSLYKRANGYSHKAVKIFPTGGEKKDEEGSKESSPLIVPFIEHYPPDTAAAIFWLKNRQPKKWRDKMETGFTDADGNDVQPVQIFQLPDNNRDNNA